MGDLGFGDLGDLGLAPDAEGVCVSCYSRVLRCTVQHLRSALVLLYPRST